MWAHGLSQYWLNLYNYKSARPIKWRGFNWEGLHFPNPLGVAGGVDKNAAHVRAWQALGAGFIEVGTVTPKAQAPNSGPVLKRNIKRRALWNHMGFPNLGSKQILKNLQALPRPYAVPVFVSLGKGCTQPLDTAHKDYTLLIRRLAPVADVFVINISSPNTKDLRALFEPQVLQKFLTPLVQEGASARKPLLLKLSPDLAADAMLHSVDTAAQVGFKGWVLGNTSAELGDGLGFPADFGGVSGEPLKSKAVQNLRLVSKHLGADLTKYLLVSTGGVMNAQDVRERLSLGAHLVQVYSALVFEGPGTFKALALRN